jgi:hypothetical protein
MVGCYCIEHVRTAIGGWHPDVLFRLFVQRCVVVPARLLLDVPVCSFMMLSDAKFCCPLLSVLSDGGVLLMLRFCFDTAGL